MRQPLLYQWPTIIGIVAAAGGSRIRTASSLGLGQRQELRDERAPVFCTQPASSKRHPVASNSAPTTSFAAVSAAASSSASACKCDCDCDWRCSSQAADLHTKQAFVRLPPDRWRRLFVAVFSFASAQSQLQLQLYHWLGYANVANVADHFDIVR